MQLPRLGIDFDGVIVDHHPHKRALAAAFGLTLEPWQLNSNLLHHQLSDAQYRSLQDALYGALTVEAPPVAGALETLARLPGELFIVSARRPENEAHAHAWMKRHHVYDVVSEDRVFFCREGKEKNAHATRLGLTTFLDDKLSYLAHLSPEMQRVLFDIDGAAARLELPSDVRVARAWEEFYDIVASDVARGA